MNVRAVYLHARAQSTLSYDFHIGLNIQAGDAKAVAFISCYGKSQLWTLQRSTANRRTDMEKRERGGRGGGGGGGGGRVGERQRESAHTHTHIQTRASARTHPHTHARALGRVRVRAHTRAYVCCV